MQAAKRLSLLRPQPDRVLNPLETGLRPGLKRRNGDDCSDTQMLWPQCIVYITLWRLYFLKKKQPKPQRANPRKQICEILRVPA